MPDYASWSCDMGDAVVHCPHWWLDLAPCCNCGADAGRPLCEPPARAVRPLVVRTGPAEAVIVAVALAVGIATETYVRACHRLRARLTRAAPDTGADPDTEETPE